MRSCSPRLGRFDSGAAPLSQNAPTRRVLAEDGAPAEPKQLTSVIPSWETGDTIHLGKRTLRVIGKRDDDADQPPVLIVEDA